MISLTRTTEWLDPIETREASIVVVGLGYVGLPLAVGFAEAGFPVVGYDTDVGRTEAIRSGRSPIDDVPGEVLERLVETKRLDASSDPSVMRHADVIILCVPTPFHKAKQPDLSCMIGA